MRHIQHIIETARQKGRKDGLKSQEKQHNDRLKAALESGPIMPIESYLVHEFISINPKTGQIRYLELRHDLGNGTNRYNLYIDGKKYGRQWSRSSFDKFIFNQIESVRRDWE